MNTMENAQSDNSCIQSIDDSSVELFRDDTAKESRFTFDRVFAPDTTQEEVYKYVGQPMVKGVMTGYNTTIFTYGQTGSGKTHTMMGNVKSEEEKGIIPRLVNNIFEAIENSDEHIQFTVKLSYIEIYNEKIRDLLDLRKTDLKIREQNNSVWVEDATEHYVSSFAAVLELMAQGQSNRAIASTNMNLESSRSHSVFMLTLGQVNNETGAKKGAKLVLVDLAGSEKIRKTGAEGQTLKEAQHINKSLSALGNVINALSTSNVHIPYRDSKLTRLLSDSLGGNSKTCLCVTCSPHAFNAEETLSTIRFGTRAKLIKNRARVNQEKSVSEYKRLVALAVRRMLITVTTLILSRIDMSVVSAFEDEAANRVTKEAMDRATVDVEDFFNKSLFSVGSGDYLSEGSRREGDSSARVTEFASEDLEELEKENTELKESLQQVEAESQMEIEKREKELYELRAELQDTSNKLNKVEESLALHTTEFLASETNLTLQNKKIESLEAELQATLKQLDDERVQQQEKQKQGGKEVKQHLHATEDKQVLLTLLAKKADEYTDLQIALQANKEHTSLVEEALNEANKKIQILQSQPHRKLQALQHKLAAAEMLCKKLLESGIYWRTQRQKKSAAQRIIIPIQGGKKRVIGNSDKAACASSSDGNKGSSDCSGSSNGPVKATNKAKKAIRDSIDRFF